MSLVTVELARDLINTSLTDDELQVVIDRVETQVTARAGSPQTDGYATTIVKTMRGEGENLFMPTEIYDVVSIVEDDVTLDASDYQTWAGGVLQRLPLGSNWGDRMVVTYRPVDDRSVRRQVVIDLVRLVLERTAMESESVGGEYSFTAPPNWDRAFNKAMRRLTFRAV